jgi:hypothetical protein
MNHFKTEALLMLLVPVAVVAIGVLAALFIPGLHG